MVAAPKQKFAGGKEGHMKELCTRSTDGKERGSIEREGVDVVLGDAVHEWAWQCWAHG